LRYREACNKLRSRLAKLGAGTLYIEPGSPWENGYCESFNGKLRKKFKAEPSRLPFFSLENQL
jgi:transposase InsO family protein